MSNGSFIVQLAESKIFIDAIDNDRMISLNIIEGQVSEMIEIEHFFPIAPKLKIDSSEFCS